MEQLKLFSDVCLECGRKGVEFHQEGAGIVFPLHWLGRLCCNWCEIFLD